MPLRPKNEPDPELRTPAPPQAQRLELWDDYDQTRSPEARFARAFDKLGTILQHTQGRHEGDFDFSVILGDARSRTDAVPLAAAPRRLLDAETAARIDAPTAE